MDLAIHAQQFTVGTEDDRGVGQRLPLRSALLKSLDERASMQGAPRGNRRIPHRGRPRTIERLGAAGPGGIPEAGRSPEFREDDEVGPLLRSHESRGALGARSRRLLVGIPELDDRNLHASVLSSCSRSRAR